MRKFLILLVCIVSCVLAEDCSRFEHGDRVCFVGDSITHSGTYHSFVYLYYATRFPDEKIRMYSCGIGGDTASGVLNRFEWDIIPYKPDVVTVMLGMNDVGRNDYRKGKATQTQSDSRALHVQEYKTNMRQVASKIKQTGASQIFISPSIYDQTAQIDCANNYGANDALKSFADFNKILSSEAESCFIDFHNPMRQINEKLQQKDPSLTIIGKDRIHPATVGNFIMAYLFLTSQGLPEYVLRADIDVATGKYDGLNCDLSNFVATDDSMSFDCLAKSLPFPVPAGAKKALELVGFMDSLNKEMLVVKGLDASAYDLFVDDIQLGTFSGSQLSGGINLANIEQSPSYEQALKVAEINQQRRNIEFELRLILFVEHKMLKRRVVEPFDMGEIRLELEKCMMLREGTSTYNNYRRKVELYYAKKALEGSMRQQIEGLIDQMYIENKPVNRKLSLVLSR